VGAALSRHSKEPGAMELPTTLEHCHRMIQELVEENAVLRKSGDDFGHLAERLNSALQEERRRASEQQFTIQPIRTGIRMPRPNPGVADGAARWPVVAAGLLTPSSSTIHNRRVRPGSAAPRVRTVRWVL
jgi:hypothetical protein